MPAINRSTHRAVDILADLIAIQSVNPVFEDGAQGERSVAEYVERFCLDAGLEVTRQSVFPARDNIVAALRVGRPQQALLFEAHMDTVALGSMVDPLVPKLQSGRIYGRGACDTKGSLAGMLYAIEALAANRADLSSDVILCASVDEEHAYRGLLRFLERDVLVSAAIVGEPTEMRIVTAHKGCARFTIRTSGKAAHSSMPHEGQNAIYAMVQILQFLRDEYEPSLSEISHPLCGSPTVVVGMIRGGTQVNIVPEQCEIEIDRRTIPGEDAKTVIREFEHRLRESLPSVCQFELVERLLDWPLSVSGDTDIVQAAQVAANTLSLSTEPCGVPYGTDASKLQHLGGIPSIVFGPGSITQAHSSEEWVAVTEVEQAAEFYLNLSRTFGRCTMGRC